MFVVDDDVSMQKAIESLLQSAGLAARAFSSGEELFAQLSVDAPACLVLDLNLPGQSGLEQLNLRIEGDGRWRIELMLHATDPAAQARLAAAGFAPGPGGYVRRIEGNF